MIRMHPLWAPLFVAALALAACAEVGAPSDGRGTLGGSNELATVEGEATLLCGGPKELQCPKGSLCERHAGQCGNPGGWGKCVTPPTECPRVSAPVCGCDGKTYANDCQRLKAGVGKNHDGKCVPKCGGIAGVGCPRGSFCLYPPGTCSWADMQGTCVKPPQACPDVWDPVCGCDGKTYSNECDMKAAGVSMNHDGACCDIAIKCAAGFVAWDSDGDGCNDTCKKSCKERCDCYDAGLEFENGCFLKCMNCGNFWTCSDLGLCEEQCGFIPPDAWQCMEVTCESNADCAEGDYCAKDGCKGSGKCQPRPEACIAIFDPVCGCDGKTYGNGCEAAGNGVNVAYKGECKPQFCGGIAGFVCPEGLLCDMPAGTCDIVDNMGTCVPKPEVCPKLWAPVCDCKGTTWPNDCERLAAGAQKAHDGECKVSPCAPQDAYGVGACDMFLGWFWNGKECVGQSGCSCSGADCGAGFMDLGACKKAYEGCACKPLECSKETVPVDADGDGCDDLCQCQYAIDCLPGYFPVDTNGDGCADSCQKSCHNVLCKPPKLPVDLDGDGCLESCVCGMIIDCAPGYYPVDSDGDGCDDACKPACKELFCSKEQWATDTNGDGCPDKCYCMLAIDCAPGYKAVDTNNDGCPDSCKAFCDAFACLIGTPIDTDGDGCPDACK
ncbi:MAG: hypothetical protein AMXMBFR64_00590 [Myxococcales bacterium]